ncbi:hypothetical protein N0Y54_36755 [Nostoc punctiforme UO1]|uniref:hypothetical protein n=1 Tax=Nostoc punctiforme TaxID=272131 RepID=UPI0030999127
MSCLGQGLIVVDQPQLPRPKAFAVSPHQLDIGDRNPQSFQSSIALYLAGFLSVFSPTIELVADENPESS